MSENVNLLHGDCLKWMPTIPANSVDMILCDLPYGVTARNDWDVLIPLDALWAEYKRITTPTAAVVLFGMDKFTMTVMASNAKTHRYNLIWDKELVTGHLNSSRMPLRQHEDIMIFYVQPPIYHPQKYVGASKSHSKGVKSRLDIGGNTYGKANLVDNSNTHGNVKFPTSVVRIPAIHPSKKVHPQEKPIELLEWLIKTYSDPNMTVLDNCMGSGTTGVACINTNRRFIGIEKEDTYFNIAKTRVEDAIRTRQTRNLQDGLTDEDLILSDLAYDAAREKGKI